MILTILTSVAFLQARSKYKYIIGGIILLFLFSINISIKAETLITAPNENNESLLSLPAIKDYFEIGGVLLDVGVILLLWKTVKDFAELAKVSKLQTEVRFRPWVGPSGGFEFLREDNNKKQYSIAMKNFGEVPASNVIVTSAISNTKPDKSGVLENTKSSEASEFHIGPLLPGMEKRYWVFIENEIYRKAMEGTSDIFVFVYFSYIYSSGKSGYGMISQFDTKTNNFVHREMWID